MVGALSRGLCPAKRGQNELPSSTRKKTLRFVGALLSGTGGANTLRASGLADIPDEDGQRVCVVVNGTVERDGTQRKYGLLCRDHHSTPLEAVAASYGVAPDLYRSLERRT